MTEEQTAEMERLGKEGLAGGVTTAEGMDRLRSLGLIARLLEERKRLLEALRALESPCPDATSRAMLFQRQEEARLAARAAIAFAEEKAP